MEEAGEGNLHLQMVGFVHVFAIAMLVFRGGQTI